MSKKKTKKKKFTLGGLLHRVSKVDLVANVVIDDEVVKDHVVGWVELRGSQDPVYISRSAKFLREYQNAIAEASSEEDEGLATRIVESASLRFTSLSVACAIESWDEEFFEEPFQLESAISLFQKEENFLIYNQLASHMQKSIDFLPNASQQP